jgi:hypothetical protein
VQTTERDDLRGRAVVHVVVDLWTFKVSQDGEVVTDRCLCRVGQAFPCGGGPGAVVRKPTSSNKKSPAEATAGEVQFQQDTHPGVVYRNTRYVVLFPLYGAKFSAFPDAVLRTLPRV